MTEPFDANSGLSSSKSGPLRSPYVCPVHVAVQDWLAAEALRRVFA